MNQEEFQKTFNDLKDRVEYVGDYIANNFNPGIYQIHALAKTKELIDWLMAGLLDKVKAEKKE